MDSGNRPTVSNPLLAQVYSKILGISRVCYCDSLEPFEPRPPFKRFTTLRNRKKENEEASGRHPHPAETSGERIDSPIPKPDPKCDAEATSTSLLNGELVNISSWRVQDIELAKRYPRQHKDCPRILWKIVDFIEQHKSEICETSTPQPLTIPNAEPWTSVRATLVQQLMHDIYTLSRNHDFIHVSSGGKLATLVSPVEAVAIHRELLERDSAGFDPDSVLYLERALSRMSNEMWTLKERIALTRQLLILEPGRATAIRQLANLLIMLYDRTSEDSAFYEARSLRDELVRRDQKEDCMVMDQIEAE